ncbi:DUF3857 domain-containing protein [Pedobacter frigoris]|uniref:DUF3857 domain-containing protein n=1 Tax=Pedobacter frigoris TaxID=2571272 RepID=UPI002930865B|nr:DUF3857 domain-containing protein [Pedobacter frigoris]
MKCLSALLFFFISCILNVNAQNFEYGKLTGDDLDLKNVVLDSNANAMVIREFGTSSMRLDERAGRMVIDFEYHVKIKIFNKNGFESGNIVIPRRVYSDNEDQIEDLRAVTTAFINGNVVATVLDKKNIFTERKNKYIVLTKFTMPNLTEGCVIEYSYRMILPSIFNFKSWDFQSNIPKLHSEYVAVIPALYNYNASLRGGRKLTSNNAELQKNCFRAGGYDADCSKLTYIMKNVPAFIEEDYMTSPDNFKSAIYYELSDYHTWNGGKKNVTKTWKDVDYELTSDKSFGTQMKRKDIFKNILPDILRNTTDELSKAQAIYAYIKANIRRNGFIGIYSETNIKNALDTHTGNTGDINLALIAALSAADLDVDAVILSTRSNGTVNTLYPVISDFNYVVAKVNIGTEIYLLDATEPLMPFGLLPLHCINGQGRVVNLKKPSYWYDIKASQKDVTRYTLNAELTNDGILKGQLITYSSGYSGLKKRMRIKAANSVEEFVEKLDEQMPRISINKHDIQNLDSLENPLVEEYDIEMKVYDDINKDQLFFNPFFINRIEKNPFNLNERTYPVDFGATREERVSIFIKLPNSYTIADKPKDMAMSIEDNGGKYMNTSTLEGDTFISQQVLQLSKPVYEPEEYLSLKEFYSRLIQLQKTDVVFKKNK